MENLVPLGTGNSRFMKSNISPNTTLAQLIQMLNNGTFPYDVGSINPAGISQQGTPLNKATLLQDATAALYGLGSDAVPDDVLEMLSAAALAENNPIIDYSVSTSTAQLDDLNVLGPGKTFSQKPEVGDDGNYVTSGYSFQATGGSYSSGEYPDFKATSLETCWAYRAKHNNEYFFVPDSDHKTVYYVPDGGGVWADNNDCFFEVGSASKDVIGVGSQIDKWSLKTVLGDDIVVGAQIATGSYVGTGTYGASNKNNVYVGFYPKLFVIYGTNYDIDFWFFRCGAMSETDQPNMYGRVGSGTSHDLDPNHARYVPDNGGGIRWWNENSADGQLNNSNITYYYTALG